LDWCVGGTVVLEVLNVVMAVLGSNNQYRV
jgi:hypothetical protein